MRSIPAGLCQDTCSAGNEDDNNTNIYSDWLNNYYLVLYGKLKLDVVVSVVVERRSVVVPPLE